MLSSWVIEKLEALKDEQILLVQDSLRLLPEADGTVHRFANEASRSSSPPQTSSSGNSLKRQPFQKKQRNCCFIDRAPPEGGPMSLTKRLPLLSGYSCQNSAIADRH